MYIDIDIDMSHSLPATVRNVVWNTYIGVDNKSGICLCCNSEKIGYANFECGHILARANGGNDTIGNLRPICSLCNKSMGTKNMRDFIDNFGFDKHPNWDGVNVKRGVIKDDECDMIKIKDELYDDDEKIDVVRNNNKSGMVKSEDDVTVDIIVKAFEVFGFLVKSVMDK